MERVAIDELAATELRDGTVRRSLADPLDAAHVAINRYRVPPGAGFPGGLHAHLDQEEAFVVLSGEATFETLDGEVTASSGTAVRFAPGEYQSGRNDGEADLVALAIGAPRDSDDTRIPFACQACGFDGLRLDADGDGLRFRCPDCGVERTPAPCPACGSDDLRSTLGDREEPVAACLACGATYDEPPLED
jgi:mannose-6-phosphate isomerase-like protein (cupin superfamily)